MAAGRRPPALVLATVLAAVLAVPGLAGCGLRDRAGGTATSPAATGEPAAEAGTGSEGTDGGTAGADGGAGTDAGAAGETADGGDAASGGVTADDVEALEDALTDATGTLQDLEDELAQDR